MDAPLTEVQWRRLCRPLGVRLCGHSWLLDSFQQIPDALSPIAFLFGLFGEAFVDFGVNFPGTGIVEIVRDAPVEHIQWFEHPAHIVSALATAQADAGGEVAEGQSLHLFAEYPAGDWAGASTGILVSLSR